MFNYSRRRLYQYNKDKFRLKFSNTHKHGNKEKLSINNFSSFICNIVDEKSFLEIKRGDFNNKRKFNNVPYSPFRLSKEIRIV